jgi:hypothetical protein
MDRDLMLAWAATPEGKDFRKSLEMFRNGAEDDMAVAVDSGVLHKAAIYRGRSQGIQDAIDLLDQNYGGQDEEEDDNVDTTGG